jgi:hypothetical protein
MGQRLFHQIALRQEATRGYNKLSLLCVCVVYLQLVLCLEGPCGVDDILDHPHRPLRLHTVPARDLIITQTQRGQTVRGRQREVGQADTEDAIRQKRQERQRQEKQTRFTT